MSSSLRLLICIFLDSVRILYFLTQTVPSVIFVDDFNAIKLQDAVTTLKKENSKLNPTIVVFGEAEGFISLKTILTTEVDEKEIDEFYCKQLNSIYDTAIVMFSSNATSYLSEAQIPYLMFSSPANYEVPVMNYGEIGLWYGSLCWTHSLILTIRAILTRTTTLKIPKHMFDEEHLYETIEKYKVA